MEKFVFKELIDPYKIRRKCGAESLALAAIASSASMLGSVYSAESAANQQQSALNQSKEENKLNREFQSVEAEKARQFTTSEREAQQAYQTGQMQTLMDYNRQLQSPRYQVRELQAAGLNPAVYFSGSNSFSGGSSPSVSAPSGASSPLPQGSAGLSSINPVVPDWAPLLGVGSSIVKNLADAGLSKSQTELTFEKVYTEQIIQEEKKIDVWIKKNIKDAEVRKAWEEVKVLSAEAALKAMQGKNFEKDTELKEAERKVQEAIANRTDQESLEILERITDLRATRDARIDNIRSGSEANRASAVASRSEAALTDEKTKFERFTNNLREKNKVQEQEKYLSGLVRDGAISDAEAAEARRRLKVLNHMQKGSDFAKAVDDFTEWLKSKISIFK